jgi:hypothetical protein
MAPPPRLQLPSLIPDPTLRRDSHTDAPWREHRALLWAGVCFFVALSLVAELRSVARPDIGFLLYAAGQVLDGARLYVDVVEINPPLIVALNVPSVVVARFLGVSEILVYRLGFALTLGATLVLSWRALGRALGTEEPGLRRFVLVLLAFVLFPVSAQDFGQREHLLLGLTVPYLLTVAGRAVGREPPRGQALAIGALAGIAFALKPHFLPMWVALELYLWRRAGRRRLTPESAGIGAVLLAYVASVALLTPQYFRLVAMLGPLYGRFLYDSFFHLLITGPGAALVWISLLAYVALRDRARHPQLWTAIAIAVLAAFLGGALQQKGLRYHFLPSFSLALVLLGLAAADVTLPLRSGVQRLYRLIAVSLAITAVLVVSVENLSQVLHSRPSAEEQASRKLVQAVRERARDGSIFVFSYHIGSAYPLINYSGVRSASRFPQLWILAAAYRDQMQEAGPLRFRDVRSMSAAERYLNESVLADLRAKRPRVLLVLRNARDLPENSYRRLDYLAYFSRDPRFSSIFSQYERVEDIGEYAIYRRLATGEARRGPAPAPERATLDVLRSDRQDLRLRIQDPAFLLRLLAFVCVLAVVAFTGRGQRPEPAAQV